MTYLERYGRFTCSRCGHELSAMTGDDEVPARCGCVDRSADEMQRLLDEATAALAANDMHRALILTARAAVIADTLPSKKGRSR
jgi:hypothetical protein